MIDSQKKTIKWGIIGAGRIARTFATDIQYSGNASLQGIASRQVDPAKVFAEEFSVPNYYGSYAAMLADPAIDAVYIATPHSHHRDQSIAALNAGKHVLCEKPATVTGAELEDVITVAKQQGRYFMEGMWTFFMPVIQKTKRWVDEGRIGQLCHVKADFGFPLPYDPNLREYNNQLAGGCLLEMGIYPIAMAWLFLQKDPSSQSVWHHRAGNGVEDDVVILNTYGSNAATAQLTTSFRCKLNNYLTLIGTEGTITIADYWAAREARLYKGHECIDRIIEDREHQGFNHQIEQVSCEILAGQLRPSVVSWEDSRAFQRHIENIKMCF